MNGGAFVCEATNDLLQQGLNSHIIVGAWTFGYIRITACLMGSPKHGYCALMLVEEELQLWGMAGGQELSL